MNRYLITIDHQDQGNNLSLKGKQNILCKFMEFICGITLADLRVFQMLNNSKTLVFPAQENSSTKPGRALRLHRRSRAQRLGRGAAAQQGKNH